jgi:hypothetical protein
MHFLSSDIKKIVSTLCEDIASPRSLAVEILLRYEEWDQLVSLRVDPKHYDEADTLWGDTLVTDLLRKCEELPTSYDRKAISEETFLACEKQCFSSNRRLERLLFPNGHVHSASDALARSVFERAKKIVSSVLGPFPDRLLDGRFGPGATFGDRGSRTTVPDKMSSEPTLTPSAWTSLSSWASTAWARACAVEGRLPKTVSGNRFTTVPKDCTKDRGIAVEPSINVFYQLSIGKLIRSRLSRVGVNLLEGQDIHRRLAGEASTEGHLATLDLSNASDTICKNLVEFLLPRRWFDVLNDLRSPKTLFKGEFHLLEKFSSMGNGFTFELETLIFYSLVTACCELTVEDPFVSAYGDDLIFPTSCSKDVIAFLELSGFSVNTRKSFTDGRFRESCGGDFFDGIPVRGHFLKNLPTTPQELISLANGIRRSSDHRFSKVYRTWRRILDLIPVRIRSCRGPSVLGDLLIHDDFERWNSFHRNSIRYFRVYRPARFRKVSWKYFSSEVTLASALYGTESGDAFPLRGRRLPWFSLGVSPRDNVLSYKLGWVSYS